MADWQRKVWQDILAVDGIVPPLSGSATGSVLVVGDGLPVVFGEGVLVVHKTWGEALGDETGFARIVVLADGTVKADYPLLLTQMWRKLRPDGLLVVVAARPSPFGMRRTAWWRGFPQFYWKRWLRAANWLVADSFTVGFCARWARCAPWGGPIRVILAQKRVGGMKIMAKDGQIKPVGVPV